MWSDEARTSNSRPSQAPLASAAVSASSEFSLAARQSPRWARRNVFCGATSLPDRQPRGDPEMVARVDRRIFWIGPVEGEPGRLHSGCALDPDVVETARGTLGVH